MEDTRAPVSISAWGKRALRTVDELDRLSGRLASVQVTRGATRASHGSARESGHGSAKKRAKAAERAWREGAQGSSRLLEPPD